MAERIYMAKESTSQQILTNMKKIIEKTGKKPKRYGMRINRADSNPDTRVEYIYDAVGMKPACMNYSAGEFDFGDWGDVWFVKNNRPVMLKTDGTVDYELNPDNYALKKSGGASDVENTAYEGNAMSEIPLVWVKRWAVKNYDYIVFCEQQYDETYKAYAHTDADGNVLPVTYLPMFEGSEINNRMRSLSGQTPTVSKTDEQETTAAQQNGDRWDKLSFSEVNLMYEMCTMISRSTNSQDKFGYGVSSTSTINATGELKNKGQFYGTNDGKAAVKIFHCENFYGKTYKRIRGLMLVDGMYLIKATPPYNPDGTGYINIGMTVDGNKVSAPIPTAQYMLNGYVSRMELAKDIGRIPTKLFGSEGTYECDYCDCYTDGTVIAQFGGQITAGKKVGLTSYELNASANSTSGNLSTSISCKPPVNVTA